MELLDGVQYGAGWLCPHKRGIFCGQAAVASTRSRQRRCIVGIGIAPNLVVYAHAGLLPEPPFGAVLEAEGKNVRLWRFHAGLPLIHADHESLGQLPKPAATAGWMANCYSGPTVGQPANHGFPFLVIPRSGPLVIRPPRASG